MVLFSPRAPALMSQMRKNQRDIRDWAMCEQTINEGAVLAFYVI